MVLCMSCVIQQCTIDELIEIIPAPDFPTAGLIYGVSGVRDGYRTGRGRVVMRAKTHFEEFGKEGRTAIIVDELPYQVNKKSLLERIAENVRDKKLEGISDIRDESDKSGMRVVIELKRGEVPEVVLNNLYKQTQLQDTFGMNMVALVNGQPKLLNLKQMLECFLHIAAKWLRVVLYLNCAKHANAVMCWKVWQLRWQILMTSSRLSKPHRHRRLRNKN